MNYILSKTDYLLFRECAKNVWYKAQRPDIYSAFELSEFEKAIIETGNEVELLARKLFPGGFLVEGRGVEAQKTTQGLLAAKKPMLFQPAFEKNGFFAAVDILELNSDGSYNIYEVKSTTDVDKKRHWHDLAFQVNLLELCGLKIKDAAVIHLNSEYVRKGKVEVVRLFHTEHVTAMVMAIKEDVLVEMQAAIKYLSQEAEPLGFCSCVYKGRSNHCSTFAHANPNIPEYGVHDISRIGASKKTLQELVDVGIFELKDVSEEIMGKLSLAQKNQIEAHVNNRILIDLHRIQQELGQLEFPLYFLDYETYPSAIPRFDGFSPYQQIPFQYSLFVLDAPGAELKHYEFLFAEQTDPTLPFLESLKENIGRAGSIIVWNKKFECTINEQMAERNLAYKDFIAAVNARVYDLMDIFGKQYYVHKDFKGRISIKNVLPVLAPDLSYKTLTIQEGGTASQKWNEIYEGMVMEDEKQKIIADLKEYCKLDTHAMVKIWQYLTYLNY